MLIVVKSKSENFREMLLESINFWYVDCVVLRTFPIDQMDS